MKNAIELYTDYLVQNNVENTQQGQYFLRVVEQVSKNRNLDTEKALRNFYESGSNGTTEDFLKSFAKENSIEIDALFVLMCLQGQGTPACCLKVSNFTHLSEKITNLFN